MRLIKKYNLSKMDIVAHKGVDASVKCPGINLYEYLKGF
jgi:hypothetical protein